MKPSSRRRFFRIAIVVALVAACLVFRRVGYMAERFALELRYSWWLFLILIGGGWLLVRLGRDRE